MKTTQTIGKSLLSQEPAGARICPKCGGPKLPDLGACEACILGTPIKLPQTFTTGPWQCYADLPSTDPNWHIVTNESRHRVIANVYIEPGNAMDAANARLIAASPALFAALQGLVAEIDGGTRLLSLGESRSALALAQPAE